MMQQWHTLEPQWKPEKIPARIPLEVNGTSPVFPEHREVLLAFKQYLEEIGWVPPRPMKELEIPGLRESHLGYWIRRATSNELLDAGFREWEVRAALEKERAKPALFPPDCAGRPPRFYHHPTAHYQIYNDLNDGPYKLHRDPSTNWGITVHMAAKAQTWSCCGMDIDHPGCWMGQKMYSYDLYDLAPAFKKKDVWRLVFEEDFEGIRQLWRVPPQVGTKWLHFGEYDRIDREIRQGKIEVENDIIQALRVTGKEPEKLTHLLKLQTILNSPQCVKYPPEDYLGFTDRSIHPPVLEPIIPHHGEYDVILTYSDEEEILDEEIREQENSQVKEMEREIRNIAEFYRIRSNNRKLFRTGVPASLPKLPRADEFARAFQNALQHNPTLENLRKFHREIVQEFQQFQNIPVLQDNTLIDNYEHDKLLYAQLKISIANLEREQINSRLIARGFLSARYLKETNESAIKMDLYTNFRKNFKYDPANDAIVHLYLGQTEKFENDLAISKELDKRKKFSKKPTTDLEALRNFPTDEELEGDFTEEQLLELRSVTTRRDFDLLVANYKIYNVEALRSDLDAFLAQFENQAKLYDVEKLNDFIRKLNNTNINTREDLMRIRREWDTLVGNVQKDFERPLPDGARFSDYLTDRQFQDLVDNAGFKILVTRHGPRELVKKVELAKQFVNEQNAILQQIDTSHVDEAKKQVALQMLQEAKSLLDEIDVYNLDQKKFAIEQKRAEIIDFIREPPPPPEPDKMPAYLGQSMVEYIDKIRLPRLKDFLIGYTRILLLDAARGHENVLECQRTFYEILSSSEGMPETEFFERITDDNPIDAKWKYFHDNCLNLWDIYNEREPLLKQIDEMFETKSEFVYAQIWKESAHKEFQSAKELGRILRDLAGLPDNSEIPNGLATNKVLNVKNRKVFELALYEEEEALKMSELNQQQDVMLDELRKMAENYSDGFNTDRTKPAREYIDHLLINLTIDNYEELAKALEQFKGYINDEDLELALTTEFIRSDIKEQAAKSLTRAQVDLFKKLDVFQLDKDMPEDIRQKLFSSETLEMQALREKCIGLSFDNVRKLIETIDFVERIPKLPELLNKNSEDLIILREEIAANVRQVLSNLKNDEFKAIINLQLDDLEYDRDCLMKFYKSFEMGVSVDQLLKYWTSDFDGSEISDDIEYILKNCQGKEMEGLRQTIAIMGNQRTYNNFAREITKEALKAKTRATLISIQRSLRAIPQNSSFEEHFIFSEVNSAEIQQIREDAKNVREFRQFSKLKAKMENARIVAYRVEAKDVLDFVQTFDTIDKKIVELHYNNLMKPNISFESAKREFDQIVGIRDELNSVIKIIENVSLRDRLTELYKTHGRLQILPQLEVWFRQNRYKSVKEWVDRIEKYYDTDVQIKMYLNEASIYGMFFEGSVKNILFSQGKENASYNEIVANLGKIRNLFKSQAVIYDDFEQRYKKLLKSFKFQRTEKILEDLKNALRKYKNRKIVYKELSDFDEFEQSVTDLAKKILAGIQQFDNFLPDRRIIELAGNCIKKHNQVFVLGHILTETDEKEYFVPNPTFEKLVGDCDISKYANGLFFEEFLEVWNNVNAETPLKDLQNAIRKCQETPHYTPVEIADMMDNNVPREEIQIAVDTMDEELQREIEEIWSIFDY